MYDCRYLYRGLIKSHLDLLKYNSLSKNSDRFYNLLKILENKDFPEVLEFIKCIEERGIELSLSEAISQKQIIEKSIIMLNELSDELEIGWEKSEIYNRSVDLQSMFSLSTLDLNAIFGLVVLKKLGPKLNDLPIFKGEYQDYTRYNDRIFDRSFLMKFIGEDAFLSSAILNEESNILKSGLIEDNYFDKIRLSEALFNYFCLQESSMNSLHKLEINDGPLFDLNSFCIDNDFIEVCKLLLESKLPTTIIFTGEPGVGKTELARALAASVGKKAFFVPTSKPGKEDRGLNARKIALSLVSQTSNLQDEIIVIDESDDLLHSKIDMWSSKSNSGNKEWLNSVIDKNKAKLIFITNHNLADESTLRRASVVINFEKPERHFRMQLIKAIMDSLNQNEFLSKEEILELVDMDLSQGIIALAMKDAISVSEDTQYQKFCFHSLIKSRQLYYKNKNDRKVGLINFKNEE